MGGKGVMAQVSYGTITITDINDIESIKNWYLATNASSGVTKTTLGWTDTIQQMTASKQYLWNYEQILGSDNVEISSTQPVIIGHYGINGQNGADGNSIVSITEYYQVTNSTTNPGASGWQTTLVVPTSTNKYLWNYQVVNYSKTAAEGSYSDARIIGVYGDTGPQGPQGVQGPQGETGLQGDTGISVTGTKEIYFLKRTTDNIPTAPADGVTTISTSTAGGIWTTVVPNYIEGGIYYTSIQTTYSSGTSPKSSTAVINQGLTDANAKALAAYNTSTARDTEINALQAQAKHYWWDNQGAHVAAGENTTNVNNITQGTPSTYGFNSLMAPGYLALKYKDINFVQLATNSLTFYRPATNDSTYVQGKKGMDLTADALTFYKPLAYNSANEPTAAATLNANGLVLSEGGLEAGTKNTTDYIYLYSTDEPTNHTININNSGNKSDWRIVAGNKFGVDKAGNLYASNANISGTIAVGTGSSISADTQINGAAASTVVSNASHGQSAYTNGIQNAVTEVQYAISSSNDNNNAPPSSSYTSNLNALNWTTTNRYVWTRTKITKTPINGVASVEYQPSEAGTYDKPLSDALYVANTANTTANEAAPKTDAMYRTQRIYWRSTYNSLLDTTPTPQINQTWLTTSGSGYGNWSLTVPPMTVDIVNYIKLTVIDSAAKVDDLQEIQLVYASSNGSASYPTYDYNSVFGNSPIWEDTLENADGENIWMGIGVILESQPITSNNFATYFYTPVQINNLVNGTTFGNRGLTTTIEYCNSNAQNIQNLSDSEEWVSTIPAWNNEKTNYYVKINTTVKFPYLFTALQTQTVNQYNGGVGVSCSCSEVLLDNTTTIIDGGSIITGTIDVNKLSAYDATIGQIKAGVIQGLDRKIDMSPDATGTSLEENFNTIKNTLVFQAEQIYFSNDTVESDVHNLLDSYVQNITIDTGSGGASPYIQVGQSTGFYVQITQNRLSFMHGSTGPTELPIEIAYIDGERNQLFIGQSVVLEEMDVGDPLNGLGQWAWTVHANTESVPRNNLTLKWLG